VLFRSLYLRPLRSIFIAKNSTCCLSAVILCLLFTKTSKSHALPQGENKEEKMDPHKKRILCVEDDDETCALITELLDLINCEVTTAQSAGEALKKIESEKFDLYLLDNWLPGGSGIDLCRRIRETDKVTPIVFYSGAAYETDKQEGLAAGAQAYLVKPADISLLVTTIRELLGM